MLLKWALFLEHNNFIPADPLKTPDHIAPVWYFTPFYSILRAIPPMFGSQFPGVLAMGAALLILIFLPWLDRAKVRSVRYRGNLYKSSLILFVISFFILGYLGVKPTNVWGSLGPFFGDVETAVVIARICTMIYFAFFILMPLISKFDKTKPLPKNLT